LFCICGCSPLSYLTDHNPGDLIVQKKSWGGAAQLVGSELSSPSFSLFADGTVVFYEYGKSGRKLVEARLDRSAFFRLYKSIDKQLRLDPGSAQLIREKSTNKILQQAPVTAFYFKGQWKVFPGLGFYESPLLDSLEEFNRYIDKLHFSKTSDFKPDSIVLYVRKMDTPVSNNYPAWSLTKVTPDKIYKRYVGYYAPNVEENSRRIGGRSARKIMSLLGSGGMYRKFQYRNSVYSLGARILVQAKISN